MIAYQIRADFSHRNSDLTAIAGGFYVLTKSAKNSGITDYFSRTVRRAAGVFVDKFSWRDEEQERSVSIGGILRDGRTTVRNRS